MIRQLFLREPLDDSIPHGRVQAALLAIYTLLWCVLAIEPVSRFTWVLENILLILGFAAFVASYRWHAWRLGSCVAILVFLVLHTIGAHYTYSLVPYDAWAQSLFGGSISDLFGWQRNHFDRLVHFGYGLLLGYPVLEVLETYITRKPARYLLTLAIIMSTSMLYELIEWGAVMLFGGDEGMAFLGTQGDIWDAHQDMALATLGGVTAVLSAHLITRLRAGKMQPSR